MTETDTLDVIQECCRPQELARLLEEDKQLRAKLASLPIIEQAKGLLIGRYRIDADTAFAVLRRWSSHTNIKLRELCRLLVEAAAQPAPTRPPSGPPTVKGVTLEHLLTDLENAHSPGSGAAVIDHDRGEPPSRAEMPRPVTDLSAATDHDLLAELEAVEQAIVGATAFQHTLDASGRACLRVRDDLLAWANREHQLVTELRRRHRLPLDCRVILSARSAPETVSSTAGAA